MTKFAECPILLKNNLDTRFRSRLGTKHADSGTFRARIVVAFQPNTAFFNTLAPSTL
jgi:hypothetical protein